MQVERVCEHKHRQHSSKSSLLSNTVMAQLTYGESNPPPSRLTGARCWTLWIPLDHVISYRGMVRAEAPSLSPSGSLQDANSLGRCTPIRSCYPPFPIASREREREKERETEKERERDRDRETERETAIASG